MPRIHIVGRKNAGKTTLIVELVRELTSRGMRVGTVKHTHHHHELDTPGKDSYLHRNAGAHAVGILAPGMSAVFWPNTAQLLADDRFHQFEPLMVDCDLVLVEGHLHASAPRVEVWRRSAGETPYCQEVSGISAIITDDPWDGQTPVWPRHDVAGIADRIRELAVRTGSLS